MTVAEHILFHSLLKGRPIAEAEEEVENMLQDLGLPHKRDELTQNLSGRFRYLNCVHRPEYAMYTRPANMTLFSFRRHAEETVCGIGICWWRKGGDPG